VQVDDFLQQLNQFFLQFLLYLSLAYNVLPIWGIFLIGVAILLPFRRSRTWLLATVRRASDRLAIWAVAFVITFFVPITTVPPQWPLWNWAVAINAKGGFKEVWLAWLAMMVLAGSNIVDNLLRNRSRLSLISDVVLPIVLGVDLLAMLFGFWWLPQFGEHGRLSDELLPWVWQIVEMGLLGGFLTELWIAAEIP
jgi:hypothetical protein